MKMHEGNGAQYDLSQLAEWTESPLRGKSICFLGSSVTLGYASEGVSFADYIGKRHGVTAFKEAVSGTTLVDNGDTSYVARMKTIDKAATFDLFVCQLSTNDAKKQLPLGVIRSAGQQVDPKTICGAIESIIDYVDKTWGCPLIFYTNCHYENEHYAEMVGALHEMKNIYPSIGIIDLYTDRAFNAIADEQRALYMADRVHPTKAGYLMWWMPKIEAELVTFLDVTKS